MLIPVFFKQIGFYIMPSLINVKDLYNKVAIACGFPVYTNNTDTPDITRFILEMISEGLNSTIDILSSNSVSLNRHEELTTIAGQEEYGVTGLIKHIELEEKDSLGNKTYIRLKYLDDIDFMRTRNSNEKNARPFGYVINNGYLRLIPCPDKAYNIKMELSTNDLVLSDNDVYRCNVEHIDDSIIGTKDFGDVVFLRTCALILLRAKSPTAQLYTELQNARIRTMVEKDYGSNEGRRMGSGYLGHYNPDRGLLG